MTGATISRAKLVTAYGALIALRYAIYALPGTPYYRTAGEAALAVAIDLALLLFVARGSRAAIVVALALHVVLFAGVFFASVGPPDPGVLAVVAVTAIEMLVLVALWRHTELGMAQNRTR